MAPEDTSAIILAGGKGTRLAGVIQDRPKPLAPVCGQPFLYWVIGWLRAQGVNDVVLSTGHLAWQIEAWADSIATPGLRITVRREERPLGTGGAIVHCLDAAGDPLLVMNGDSLLLADLSPAFALLAEGDLDGVLFGVPVNDTAQYGRLDVGPDGLLAGFREKVAGSGLINGGLYLLRRRLIAGAPKGVGLSMEYDLLPGALTGGARIGVVACPADVGFLDIGVPERYAAAAPFIARNRNLFSPLTLRE